MFNYGSVKDANCFLYLLAIEECMKQKHMSVYLCFVKKFYKNTTL
jgi:hypothetical protein